MRYCVFLVCRLALSTTWLRRLLAFGRIKAGPMINDVISGVLELFCTLLAVSDCVSCLQ